MEMTEIPSSTMLPFTYLQFDSSLASAALAGSQPYRCLLIGSESNGKNLNKCVKLSSEADAKGQFGDGSMLHEMAKVYFKNSSIEVWGAAIAEAAGTAPTLDAILPIIKGMQFNAIASGFSDKAFLASLASELKDRSKATRGIEGVAFAAIPGKTTDAATVVNGINSPFICAVPMSGIPSKPHEVAAAICGQVASSAQEDPARPFRTLELSGIQAPGIDQIEGREAREAALHAGVSTLYTDSSSVVRIERLITTYQKNELGADDIAYLSPATVLTLSFLRYDFARYFSLKYPRHKLAGDNYRGTGPVMTPNLARAECVCLFRMWEEQGLVQDADAFIKSLVCEINPKFPSRLDIKLQPRLVSELEIIGALLSFQF